MSALTGIINRMNEVANPHPANPFLGPIFSSTTSPVISTGFDYTPEEIGVHGVSQHGAIDFDVPLGTPVLAPADGFAMCTYGEILLHNEDGSVRTVSEAQARAGNSRTDDLRLPTVQPEPGTDGWPVYFGSYVVQIWHTRGRYTQYAHLENVPGRIPFHPPEVVKDKEGKATGDLRHSSVLRLPVKELVKPDKVLHVRRGDVIGYTGMTGCGWGQRCYGFARLGLNGRPDFSGQPYPYYTSPHLHFMAFGKRAPYTRRPPLFDPFGIYGDISKSYPQPGESWHEYTADAQQPPLWLENVPSYSHE